MATRFLKPAGLLYTYCTTGQGDEMLFQVSLPNGRKLDLQSKKGADEFVDTFGTDFTSTSLTATDDQELQFAYMLIITVADNASPEKIASGIPESELRTFVEDTRDTLDALSTERKWLRTGTVSACHELLLKTVVFFSKHPSFVKIFLSDKGMEAVAKFYASRKKNDATNTRVAQSIRRLVNYASNVLMKQGLSSEQRSVPLRKRVFLGSLFAAFLLIPKVLLIL
jgi:hypothetical protein